MINVEQLTQTANVDADELWPEASLSSPYSHHRFLDH